MSEIRSLSGPSDRLAVAPVARQPVAAPASIETPLPQDQSVIGLPSDAAKSQAATVIVPAPAPVTTVIQSVAAPSVPTTLQEEYAPPVSDTSAGRPLLTGSLGPGFPSAPMEKETLAQHLHDFLSNKLAGPYNWGVGLLLDRVSDVTKKGVGVDVGGLLQVERTLYQSLAPSKDGYGGAPPLFVALANGQAAYVNLGPDKASESDHLMRMFDGLPLSTIEAMPKTNDELSQVRQILVDRAKAGDFPVYVDMDGKFGEPTSTESIATESIASIAKRENHLGNDFPDPRTYYKWLVTRVDSAYKKLDPWLFGTNPDVHKSVESIKTNLTPPWVSTESKDPFGYSASPKEGQAAYKEMMKICGDGQPPTYDTLANIADATVSMDRDLLSGIQTYWIKLFREISPAQRESLMTPVAKAWVDLNTVPPSDPGFAKVSPENSPYIDLIEKGSGNQVSERYDRAMALSQAVGHTLDGLGIAERRQFLDTIIKEAQTKEPEITEREARLRQALGPAYHGLDVQGILSGAKDLSDPGVIQGLDELKKVAQPEGGGHCEMTQLHADIIRQRDLLSFVAGRYSNYGDVAFKSVYQGFRSESFAEHPLILSEFYTPAAGDGPMTPLPAGPSRVEVLGQPIPGKEPVKMSMVLEGGGGKGQADPEVLSQVRQALSSSQGQVAIDEFVGNSAGSINAGLLAAGYSPDDMVNVMKQLDFKKFYGDYMWLEGGVDPKVRGIDRTGLFSQQKMYDTLSALLKTKVPVEGRPVLFRDLPFKLKVTSTMLNSDISDDMKKQLGVAADGQIVFSSENTPNMDVAAAMCCSSAVPAFFNAPQIQIAQECDRSGEPVLKRMQLVDGGTVNNFPIAEAGDKTDKSFMIGLPVYYSAPATTPGGQPTELSTLNFDSTALPPINAYNDEQYKNIKPNLGSAIQKVADSGYDRVVMAFNFADVANQAAPILQGASRADTDKILALADQAGLPHMDAKAGAAVIQGNLEAKKPSIVEQVLLNQMLGKDHTFSPGLFHDPRYAPSNHEAYGVSDMIASVLGAHMTAPAHLQERLFEKA